MWRMGYEAEFAESDTKECPGAKKPLQLKRVNKLLNIIIIIRYKDKT